MNDINAPSDKTANELNSLSEVIRRHAEELSRISGRLAHDAVNVSAHGIPEPPSTPSPRPWQETGAKPPVQTETIFNFRGESANTLPARAADAAALSSDSLPVLTAFREFLEQERQRARQRTIRLGLAMIAASAALVVGGLLAGHWYVRRTRTKIEAGQVRIEAARKATDNRLVQYADKTVVLERTIARDRQELRSVAGVASNLNRVIAADKMAVAKTQAELTELLVAQAAEMEKLRDAFTTLEIENATLSGNLKNMAARLAGYETTASQEPKPEGEETIGTPPDVEKTTPAPGTASKPAVPFRLPEP